jgi:hypothetical protein
MSQLEDTTEATVIRDALTGAPLLTFDANLTEKHTADADVTSYPVEGGARTSDDAQPKQRMFELTGEITNTPLNGDDTPQRAARAFELIDRIHRAKTRLIVTSGLRVYEPCILKSYSTTRDYKTAQTLVITLMFVEIETVTLQLVEVPANVLAALRRASGKSKTTKNDKDKPPTAQQAAARRKSIGKRAADFVAEIELF